MASGPFSLTVIVLTFGAPSCAPPSCRVTRIAPDGQLIATRISSSALAPSGSIQGPWTFALNTAGSASTHPREWMQRRPSNRIVACLPVTVSIDSLIALHFLPGADCQGKWLRPRRSASPSSVSGRRLEPCGGVPGAAALARERLAEVGHAGKIVNRSERVDVRQHRPHAERPGGKTVEPQQRVDPYHPAARLAQALHLGGELLDAVPLEPVGEEDHDRALAEHSARPVAVEPGERLADAGSPRPVDGKRRALGERVVGVARAHRTADVG